MQHARGIPNATGVHRHVDDLLLDLGGVTGVAVIQEESAPVAYRLLATIALLALAGLTISDDIGPLAVGAMQDLHNHAITRLAWGLLCVSYTPRRWMRDKKAGWYAVLEAPRMPVTSTLLDQAPNALDRKLFMMKGFHHRKGNQQAFLRGLAHFYNLIPYQRRAQHARQCGVEVEGGTVSTRDWLLNLQILTSGGFR
jgi:hypothetical protein